MQHEGIFFVAHQTIDNLCISKGAKRRHNNCLRFTASKDSRTMRTLQHPNVTIDRTHSFLVTSVDPWQPLNNSAANYVLFDFTEELSNRFSILTVNPTQ